MIWPGRGGSSETPGKARYDGQMTDADAFLDAIWAVPADDTPRLVYADWLEEHGQAAHAEFIRLQCAAAREKPFSPAANELWKAISGVWRRLEDEWWPVLIDFPALDAADFSRGFERKPLRTDPATLAVRAEYWATVGVIQSLQVDCDEVEDTGYPDLTGDDAFRFLGQVRSLGLTGYDAFDVLFGSFLRHFGPRLRVLDLRHAYVSDDAIELLVNLPPAVRLSRLILSGQRAVWADDNMDSKLPEHKPYSADAEARLLARFGDVVRFAIGS
jgi:uncharacterized protein (TIGR02996 family)